MSYKAIEARAADYELAIFGAFHNTPDSTLVMFGPGPGFWPYFQRTPEGQDGEADPIDRWSLRVITDIADSFDARIHMPFGGPPYPPFLAWAIRTKRAWTSPVGMLVHDTAGLMVSYRGAIEIPQRLDLPEVLSSKPCDDCTEQPCLSACPVGAMTPQGYDTEACHTFLDSEAGTPCLTGGCAARLACPVSTGAARKPDQSAHHMTYFHKETA